MDITLDITNKFNTLVNYDYFLDNAPMNPKESFNKWKGDKMRIKINETIKIND